MTFCKKSWVVFLTLFLASPAWGIDEVPQPYQGGTGCSQANPLTIANLPTSPEYGTVCFVSNGSATSSNCSTTGSDKKACWYNGSSWVPIGDFALTFKTIDASSGTDPVADTLTDSLVMNGTSPITVTGDSTTDAVTIAIADADDDASTKGAATFNALDFNATSGSVTLSRDETIAGNPALGASDCMWSTTGIICEGLTADTIELLIDVANITTTDKTITFPDETGTVCTTGSVCSGYAASTSDITAVGPGCATGACLTDGLATAGTSILVWEGTTADTNQITFAAAADPAGAYTITFPSETGTVCTSGATCSTSVTGNAGTATALAANGANCSAGSYALGVDASGVAESCTAESFGFLTIDASSGTDPAADTVTDTLQIIGTAPISVTGDSAADSVTIAVDLSAYLTSATAATTYLKLDASNDPITGDLYTSAGAQLSIGDAANQMVVNGTTYDSYLAVHVDDALNAANLELHRHEATAADAPVIYGARSKGTMALPTVVASGDALLTIGAVGHDGTDYAYSSAIEFTVGATPGANDMPGTITFKTSADGAQSPTTRMTIDETGVVEIGVAGTGTSAIALDVYGAGSGGETPIRVTQYRDATAVDVAHLSCLSATPADGDACDLKFRGYDDLSADVMMSRIRSVIVDTDNTSEDSRIDLGTFVAGTFANMVLIGATSATSGVGAVAVQSGVNFSVAQGSATFSRSAGASSTPVSITNTFDGSFNQVLDLYSVRATPTAGDSVVLRFILEDSIGTNTVFAYLDTNANDVTDGSEDGAFRIVTLTSSSGTPTQVELFEVGATAASLNFGEFNDSSIDADFSFHADSLDGALCFDGTGAGAVTIGVNQTVAATCSGSTRAHGSITGPDLAIERNADAVLYVEADRDNATEGDNPCVVLGQDGGVVEGQICLEGDAGTAYTNSTANAFYIEGSTNGTNANVEIANGGRRRAAVDTSGAWSFETDGNGIGVSAQSGSNVVCEWLQPTMFLENATGVVSAYEAALGGADGFWTFDGTNRLPATSFLDAVLSTNRAYAAWKVPNNLTGTTADFYVHWGVPSVAGCVGGGTNADSDDVCWSIDTGSHADNSTITLGATEVYVRDECITASTVRYLKSPVITVTHSWTAGQMAVISLGRSPQGTPCGATADDDLAADIDVIGVEVCYPVGDVFNGES